MSRKLLRTNHSEIMATYRGKPPEHINKVMKILLPETNGCDFADYPMTGGAWLKETDNTPDGG
jgi:hypothetical protein